MLRAPGIAWFPHEKVPHRDHKIHRNQIRWPDVSSAARDAAHAGRRARPSREAGGVVSRRSRRRLGEFSVLRTAAQNSS